LSIDHFKKEAKRWLKALRAGDAEARARLQRANPDAPAAPGLRDVQHALARERGFVGWSALKASLSASADTGSRDAALTALLDAANRGDASRVERLLDEQADLVNARGRLAGHHGLRTALHFAVNSGDERTIDILLEHGADPNIRDEGDYAMPLHFAAEKEHLGIIRRLIEHGADPIGAGDGHELGVIGWATCFGQGRPDVVDYLLAHGARHNIFSAVAMEDVDAIAALASRSRDDLDKAMDATNHHRRPLHLAIVKKRPRSLTTLLALGADADAVDASGMTPLDQAALAGEMEMAQQLVAHGAALHLPAAVGLQKRADIERLVNEEPDCLKPGHRWGALIVRASEHGSAPVVEELIRLGASVDARDDSDTAVDGTTGYTPLHAAAFRGNGSIVALLLKHGANPLAVESKYGSTPAGWAEYAGHLDVRDIILTAAAADPRRAAMVDSFLKNASLDWRVGGSARSSATHAAERLLRRHPEIARDNIYTAVVCGELGHVERLLADDSEAASRNGGPRNWPPLLYLCSARLSDRSASAFAAPPLRRDEDASALHQSADNAVAIARALLDRGADPNAWYPGGSDGIRYTALTCVLGEGEENAPRHPRFEALVQLLLERGAEPYDKQVLYNLHFHGDMLWILQQMYDRAIALGRRADWDDPSWSMLDMGGYGCGARYLLNIALEQNDLVFAEWLLAHGASPHAPPARDRRMSKLTLAEEALRQGRQEMVDVLVRYGATPPVLTLDDEDAFGAACFHGDRDAARALLQAHPEYLQSTVAMFAAAKRDRVDVVKMLLDLGMSVDVEDAKGTRALHEAAYGDATSVIALLLERGAEVDPRESNYGSTPLGFAIYGRRERAIDLLQRASRDVFELAWIGAVERLRFVLGDDPDRARLVHEGQTPLMWLPDDEARAMAIARLLLAHGADPTVINSEGETAAVRARRRGLDEVADLLDREARRGRAPRRSPSGWSSTPPFYAIDWRTNTLAPRQVFSENDWRIIMSVMKDLGITGLKAHGQMTDAVLGRVAELDRVTRLDLADSNEITDAGLLQLARMPQLQHLDISGSKGRITDRGLEVLRDLPALTDVQMCWQQGVSDVGVSNLRFCERMETVNLLGTPTGDGALEALAGKRALRRLRSGKGVTDAGLRFVHEMPVFKTWQGGEVRYTLMSPDASPNHLLLDGSVTDEGLAGLAGLNGLFGLSLFWHVSQLTPDGLGALAALPNLGFVGCEGTLCNDTAMRHIAAIPKLRMLMAQGTVASDDGFSALSRSPTLEYLWGRECPNLTGRGFAALATMPALHGLAVSCKGVDDASLAALPRFPALDELMPMDVTDEGFRYVGRCRGLESLVCMYCRDTTDVATEHIAGLSRLKRYYAGSSKITDRSLEILSRMPSLQRVTLEHCVGVTDAGVAHLATLPNLREVSLGGMPRVTRAGAASFPARVRVSYSA